MPYWKLIINKLHHVCVTLISLFRLEQEMKFIHWQTDALLFNPHSMISKKNLFTLLKIKIKSQFVIYWFFSIVEKWLMWFYVNIYCSFQIPRLRFVVTLYSWEENWCGTTMSLCGGVWWGNIIPWWKSFFNQFFLWYYFYLII